jgi:hypothetical protein
MTSTLAYYCTAFITSVDKYYLINFFSSLLKPCRNKLARFYKLFLLFSGGDVGRVVPAFHGVRFAPHPGVSLIKPFTSVIYECL